MRVKVDKETDTLYFRFDEEGITGKPMAGVTGLEPVASCM